MNRLRSWWQSWKQVEAETDLHMGRDERYWLVRNDATRTGALTIPFTFIAALIAGAIWLPDPIRKEGLLQLGVGVLALALAIALIVRTIVLERNDVGWVNPSIDPHTYLAFLILFSVAVFGTLYIIDRFQAKPFDWFLVFGLFGGWLIFALVYTRRWRRDRQNRDD